MQVSNGGLGPAQAPNLLFQAKGAFDLVDHDSEILTSQ